MNTLITVASGATTGPILVQSDGWLLVQPSSGSTATVQYTLDSGNIVTAGSATWVTAGAFTSNTALRVEEELQDVYVRITTASGSCTYTVEGQLSAEDKLIARYYTKRYMNSIAVTVNTDPVTGRGVTLSAEGTTVPVETTLLATAMAMVLPSSGSVAANGALTLTTAVPLSGGYSWGCYMRFPAGAVYAGSAAGMYYVVMSSNSLGTIYDDIYTSGTPTVPANPTPIVAAGPGAYTQSTGAIDITSVTIPANSMGRNGVLYITPSWVFPNNANNKVLSVAFGGANFYAKTRTTATQETPLIDIRNRGVTNRQLSAWANSSGPAASSTAGIVNGAIDTTADVACVIRGQLAVATDYIIVEGSQIRMTPFP